VSGGGQRRTRILELLVGGDAPLGSRRLCEVSAGVTEVSGAGIMLMAGDVARGSLCTSGPVSDEIEQLQYTLGEGPCVDAYQGDRPVLEPDLADPVTPRWLAFTGPALRCGVRAVFAFPLHVGAVRLGALDLFNTRPGPLTADQHADALVMADVAAQAVLVMQSGARPGALAVELEAGANFQYVVHQAAGMVAAQLDASVGQALIRLRAHAFASGRTLGDVAQDVVMRTLRLDEPTDGQEPVP
jgi:hypothetical protein